MKLDVLGPAGLVDGVPAKITCVSFAGNGGWGVWWCGEACGGSKLGSV